MKTIKIIYDVTWVCHCANRKITDRILYEI